ncbi:MAG: Fe-S cluster assembly protein SufD [Anaerolineae bacterium]
MSEAITATKPQDKLLRAGVFNRELVEALSAELNEPGWLAERRRVAWGVFEETPLPTIYDEHWRRTDIRKIKWHKFRPADGSAARRVDKLADLPHNLRSALDQGKPAAGRIALINDRPAYLELDPDLAGQGVIFTDLQTAARQHPELVEPYLMTEAVPASDGKFPALNGALWRAGVFIYVPKDVVVEHPFQAAITLDGEGAAVFPRTLIVAEQFSAVDYIEETFCADGAGQALNAGVVEIYAKEAAQVRYVDVQRWGRQVYNFNTRRALCSNDSLIIWDSGQLGGGLTKSYVDGILRGDGSSMEYQGVYFADEKQHLDIDALMHHIGLSTGGDLVLYGALKDQAQVVFRGLIKIDPSGQQTNSYLKNENLLLSETCRADSIPSLEIDANDVRASHGATVGQIDEEYIFYLQSRGIPRSTAVRMVVEGFFSIVFDRMGNERVKEKLFEAASAKMKALREG